MVLKGSWERFAWRSVLCIALAGCSPDKPTASTPSGTTASVSDTAPTTPDTAVSQPTGDTGTTPAHTADTGTAACDAYFSDACYLLDGMCRDPEWTPPLSPGVATDERIDDSIDAWLANPWGPIVWTVCDGGAIAHAVWGKSETAEVYIYDGDTREWVAGYILTDDPWDICGTEIWGGDEAWLDCGNEVYDWVQQQFETPAIAVYDESTREWVGGFLLTDDPWPICGTTIWGGDEAWIDCATELHEWVQQQFYVCQPGATGVTLEDCLRDEVPR